MGESAKAKKKKKKKKKKKSSAAEAGGAPADESAAVEPAAQEPKPAPAPPGDEVGGKAKKRTKKHRHQTAAAAPAVPASPAAAAPVLPPLLASRAAAVFADLDVPLSADDMRPAMGAPAPGPPFHELLVTALDRLRSRSWDGATLVRTRCALTRLDRMASQARRGASRTLVLPPVLADAGRWAAAPVSTDRVTSVQDASGLGYSVVQRRPLPRLARSASTRASPVHGAPSALASDSGRQSVLANLDAAFARLLHLNDAE